MKNTDTNKADTNKTDYALERQLYKAGWIFIVSAIALLVIGRLFSISPSDIISPCFLKNYLGFYCPGCGGTRAIYYLLRGRVLTSFFYHPLPLYATLFGGWFMITQTLSIFTKGKIRGARFQSWVLSLLAILIVANCVIRNVLLLFQIPTL